MKCKRCKLPLVEHIIQTGFVGDIGLIHHKDNMRGRACFNVEHMEYTLTIGNMVDDEAPRDGTQLEQEEVIISDILISARSIQEFLWGDMNNEAGAEEYKRMFRKRLSKIEQINMDKPHWRVEMKKRALQVAAISVQLIYKLNNDALHPGIHPNLPSNLPEYDKIVEDDIE